MIKVIVVEDHDGLREDIVFGLENEGFLARGVASAEEFDRLCLGGLPDVAILDWNLPGEDGFSLACRLNALGTARKVGIVMLTARSGLEDRIEGLSQADAYLVKPIDLRELSAIIRSVHRRLQGVEPAPSEKIWCLLERRLELVCPNGKVIELSQRECQVLSLLAGDGNHLLSAREIVEAFGENWIDFDKNRLELLISRLRQKMVANDGHGVKNPIRAVRNKGYLLTIPIKIQG